jgi:cell division transport system permease protein
VVTTNLNRNICNNKNMNSRIFKTSLQHFDRNKGLAFASIIVMALTFFISTLFGVAFLASNISLSYLESQLPVVVTFKADAKREDVSSLENSIKAAYPKAQIDYCSQQCAIDQFKRKNPGDNFNLLVIPPYISVGTPSQQETEKIYHYIDDLVRDTVSKSNESNIPKDATKYSKNDSEYYVVRANYSYVYDIFFNQNAADIFKDISNLVQFMGIGLSVILFMVSFIIISITVSMTIFTMRKEIEIMNLVGATRFFIRAPFVIDGALFGIIGAGIATLLFYAGAFSIVSIGQNSALIPALKTYFGDASWPTLYWWSYILVLLVEMLMGGLLGSLSSFFASGRYLKD